MSRAARNGSGLIRGQAGEVHAGWEMTTNHLPNVGEISTEQFWQVASQRPGVLFSLLKLAAETDKVCD